MIDSEPMRAMLVRMMADAISVSLLETYRRTQAGELGLVRDHVYETATSGTDAAGPARDRVRAVLKDHGAAQAQIGVVSSLFEQVEAFGLDADLDEDSIRLLGAMLEQAFNIIRERALDGLRNEVEAVDGEIMRKMPLPQWELEGLVKELEQEDSSRPKGGSKIIDITSLS